MIDYKKLGRILDSADQQKLDRLINVNIDGLISQYDEKFVKHGFVKVDNNKYNLKMSEDSKSVFQITKNIALTEIDWLLNIIKKLLSDQTELKEIDLLRDQLAINNKISEGHKKLVGDLYKQIDEVKEDNKKLSEQIGNKPNELRKKG